jgi:hypothetical protein
VPPTTSRRPASIPIPRNTTVRRAKSKPRSTLAQLTGRTQRGTSGWPELVGVVAVITSVPAAFPLPWKHRTRRSPSRRDPPTTLVASRAGRGANKLAPPATGEATAPGGWASERGPRADALEAFERRFLEENPCIPRRSRLSVAWVDEVCCATSRTAPGRDHPSRNPAAGAGKRALPRRPQQMPTGCCLTKRCS